MKGLNGWMRLLEGSETAVLSTLIEELERITISDETSGAQLAEVILKDASLASSVIRIANSTTTTICHSKGAGSSTPSIHGVPVAVDAASAISFT